MDDLTFVSVSQIREYLENKSTNRKSTITRQKNTFDKVVTVIQEFYEDEKK